MTRFFDKLSASLTKKPKEKLGGGTSLFAQHRWAIFVFFIVKETIFW